jgi:hypothetical protein
MHVVIVVQRAWLLWLFYGWRPALHFDASWLYTYLSAFCFRYLPSFDTLGWDK